MLITKSRRWPEWPIWAVCLVGLWLILVAATIALSQWHGIVIETCFFKLITGVPCPMCGLSRAGWAVLHGDIIRAWWYNPLMCTVLALYFLAFVARLLTGYKVTISLSKSQQNLMAGAGLLALLLNWVYVIIYVG